jgi:hypothetical protein
MDKEQQKKLIIEIMEADSKDRLYKQQTAVDWLVKEFNLEEYKASIEFAKAKEKEQILNACYQFSDYPFNKEDHLEYYNETYNK